MATDKCYDQLYKFLIIGDSGCGKSSLLLRLSDQQFTEEFNSTIGVDFATKLVNLDDKIIKLQIWDSAGQDRFRSITCIYYRNANGVMIVFDITDRKSFKNIKLWLGELEKYAPKEVQKILVGNKCDLTLERKISYEEAREYADNLGIEYIETSAKNDEHIIDSFSILAKEVKRNFKRIDDENTIKLERQSRNCFVCNKKCF